MSPGELRVEKHVYEHRLSRMKRMTETNAPPIVIYSEAKYILASWRPLFLDRAKGWLLKIAWRLRGLLP